MATTPPRTASRAARSTGSGSPVRADSSRTAAASRLPSTRTSAPDPTMRRSPSTTSLEGTVSSPAVVYRWAILGARSRSAWRSCRTRSAAEDSSAQPVTSMVATAAAARCSPVARAPIRANRAMTSTPIRHRRRLSITVHSEQPAPNAPVASHAASPWRGSPCQVERSAERQASQRRRQQRGRELHAQTSTGLRDRRSAHPSIVGRTPPYGQASTSTSRAAGSGAQMWSAPRTGPVHSAPAGCSSATPRCVRGAASAVPMIRWNRFRSHTSEPKATSRWGSLPGGRTEGVDRWRRR